VGVFDHAIREARLAPGLLRVLVIAVVSRPGHAVWSWWSRIRWGVKPAEAGLASAAVIVRSIQVMIALRSCGRSCIGAEEVVGEGRRTIPWRRCRRIIRLIGTGWIGLGDAVPTRS
jgi:hypothetical protein